MGTIKNITLLIGRIILPTLICILSFVFFKIDIIYHILFFGLIIVLFNLSKTQYNNIVSVIFSLCISYLAFFISIGVYFGIGYLLMQFIELDKLEEFSIYGYDIKSFLLLLPFAVYSPILMFLFYKILFKINKNDYSKIVICSSIVFLIIYGLIKKDFEDEYAAAFWQIVMVFALQITLYQKELKILLKNKAKV